MTRHEKMARRLIRRYIWLIDTIRSCPNGISFEEINRKWKISSLNDDGTEMPKRTFHAHIDAIFDEFDIEITCDRTDGYRYHIDDEVNEFGSIRSSIIDSLVLGNVVYEAPAMKDKVYINTAFSQKNLGIILKSIRQRNKLEIRRVYDFSDIAKESIRQDDLFYVEPYATVFIGHWFMVCRDSTSAEMCVFALSRITEIRMLDDTFDYPETFDVRQYVDSFHTDNYYMDRFNRGIVDLHDDIDSLALCIMGEKTGMI